MGGDIGATGGYFIRGGNVAASISRNDNSDQVLTHGNHVLFNPMFMEQEEENSSCGRDPRVSAGMEDREKEALKSPVAVAAFYSMKESPQAQAIHNLQHQQHHQSHQQQQYQSTTSRQQQSTGLSVGKAVLAAAAVAAGRLGERSATGRRAAEGASVPEES
ncbi:hypothetical protein FACS189472_18270 [Alphaproteobacteria bacterium]|nr:hypothetical protein FACS189472_18270 [Alphaproteobacteria bacterium]